MGQTCPLSRIPCLSPQSSLLSADMAESALPPSSSAAPAAEPEVTEQPRPRSPPPSPPGLEEPPEGADPDVPHPDLAPVAFFCLRQTTSPRNWCIKMVCNPYPLGAGLGWGLYGASGHTGDRSWPPAERPWFPVPTTVAWILSIQVCQVVQTG